MNVVGIIWLLVVEAEKNTTHFQTSVALRMDDNNRILEVSRYPIGLLFDFSCYWPV
jgi:hypothetical protein